MLKKQSGLLPLLGLVLLGCGGSSDNQQTMPVEPPSPMYSFEVTVNNLTYGQPLSPIGIALHKTGNFWQLGQMATTELEMLAESGDNSALLGLDFVTNSISETAPLGPGNTTTLVITTDDLMQVKLSLISMMVNTNDGFSGLNAIDVSGLEVGSQLNFKTRAYDSGTEANSESNGTIPGPADMGEGFNVQRDDVDFVAVHPGVISQDDGLSQSVLSYSHKFDNPLMGISITRIQ